MAKYRMSLTIVVVDEAARDEVYNTVKPFLANKKAEGKVEVASYRCEEERYSAEEEF